MLRFFSFSIFLTLASIVLAGWELGLAAVFTMVVLIAIEIAFSFDNAILNAKILERLSRIWQQLFLTVGMAFAIIGMRFVFPIVIVMITADLPWKQVLDDALNHPKVYGEHLEEAHAAISSFGGAFLLTLTFYFLFDDARKELWLRRIEKPLQRIGGSIWLPALLALAVIGVVGFFVHGPEQQTVWQAGATGVLGYAGIKLCIDLLGKISGTETDGITRYTGWSAFLAFMYLQVLDASFSFDGVLGAFAITDQVLLIALGLGVGAIWVRSLTVYLVRNGTLGEYIYLEHGAHYAILVLSGALLLSLFVEVPDAITGIVGIGVIWASFMSSLEARKKGHVPAKV